MSKKTYLMQTRKPYEQYFFRCKIPKIQTRLLLKKTLQYHWNLVRIRSVKLFPRLLWMVRFP